MSTTRNYKKSLILFLITTLLSLPIFGFSQTSTVEISVIAPVGFELIPLPPPLPPGGPPLPIAEVVFEGKAYPDAFLTILRNKATAATFFADSSGFFKKELTGIIGDRYNFEIFAEDTEGRRSPTLSFTVTILGGMINIISGIFIPPTIELFPSEVGRGETLDIFGQSFPESQIHIFVSPTKITKETTASSQGKWFFELDTSTLTEGEYNVWAKAFLEEGEQSQISKILSFSVVTPECRGADLNFDGYVNIIDFSILLYFWHQTSPENICADINQDGTVDLIDFSITMYYWTG
jgi:hypothetical protein